MVIDLVMYSHLHHRRIFRIRRPWKVKDIDVRKVIGFSRNFIKTMILREILYLHGTSPQTILMVE